jgi:protein-S-isoprenylcysteine O-methyltransferase Ste14
MDNLAKKATRGLVQLILVLGFSLFVPAWTLNFWQGWLCLLVFATASALITIYLGKNDPKLLERRISAGPGAEKEKSQKLIQLLASFIFVAVLVLPSLDHRFSWSTVPVYVVITGDLLLAFGFIIIFLVFKENTFTGATIEVAPEQRVISTGPYAVVRHPMYSGSLVMFFGMPLALGSWWGLLMFVAMTAVIVCRLLHEERFLADNLMGYQQYRQKVKYRLLPLFW